MISDYKYKPLFYFSMTFLATYIFWFAGAYISSQEDISGMAYLFMLPGLMAPFLISVGIYAIGLLIITGLYKMALVVRRETA